MPQKTLSDFESLFESLNVFIQNEKKQRASNVQEVTLTEEEQKEQEELLKVRNLSRIRWIVAL